MSFANSQGVNTHALANGTSLGAKLGRNKYNWLPCKWTRHLILCFELYSSS